MMTSKLQLAAVFLIAFAVLSFNVPSTSIGSGWIDPILHNGAQDEATYTHEAIRMLTHAGWMTPAVLGRWVLEKPPLLMWLSAISMKLFGIGPFTARIPALLAGALIVTVCFAIARAHRSILAGLAAGLLCLSNQLLFTLSRHSMTDIVLTAAIVIVLAVLACDPDLERRRSRIAFTLALGAGVLTKSIAGLLPAFACLLFASLSGRPLMTRLRRTAMYTGLAVIVACPWFLYHLIVHRDWFLADMEFQILTIGVKSHKTSLANHVLFYLQRLIFMAPVALVLCITAIPACISALRRRDDMALALACFFAVLSASLLVFSFLSATYLTPLLPVLILIAVIYSPLLAKKFEAAVLAVLIIVFCVKAANPEQPWGISYDPDSTVPAISALSQYCEERRGNHLYILGVEDQLYGLALPLTHLHYGWIDPLNTIAEERPHLEHLGILQRPGASPNSELYSGRLRAWGLNSTEPIATALIARNVDELVVVVISHPESDFLVSPEIQRRLIGRDGHVTRITGSDYVLLESKKALPAGAPAWTCRM